MVLRTPLNTLCIRPQSVVCVTLNCVLLTSKSEASISVLYCVKVVNLDEICQDIVITVFKSLGCTNYICQNLSAMTRYALPHWAAIPIRPAVAVCPSLDIFTAPTPGRITTELSDNWRWRIGRPRQSVEADLRPMNLGLATAKRRAQDRSAWRNFVATATSSQTRS